MASGIKSHYMFRKLKIICHNTRWSPVGLWQLHNTCDLWIGRWLMKSISYGNQNVSIWFLLINFNKIPRFQLQQFEKDASRRSPRTIFRQFVIMQYGRFVGIFGVSIRFQGPLKHLIYLDSMLVPFGRRAILISNGLARFIIVLLIRCVQ